MGLHSFTRTSRTKVYFCSMCGCISYNYFESFNLLKDNKEVKAVSSSLITELPFVKYKAITPKYNNVNHMTYVLLRQKEIKYICGFGQVSKSDLSIVFRSIAYLDRLFISSKCNLNMREAALICFALSLKFNGYSIQSPIHHLCEELNQTIVNFKEKEIECLQLLNYDLSQLSSYEVIEQIFNSGILFKTIPDIHSVYTQCLSLFYEIIIDSRSLDFSQSVLALSIIQIVCNRFSSFSLKEFSSAYKVNYANVEMKKCLLVLNAIIQSKHLPLVKKREKKTKTNCSSSTIDTIESN